MRERAVGGHVAVGVPVVVRADVDQLDEAHAALGEAAGDEALPREAFAGAVLQAVEVERGVGLAAEVEHLGHGHLHAGGGLEGFQPGDQRGVGGMLLLVLAVKAVEQAEFERLDFGGGGAADEIRDRLRTREDARAGMDAGEKVGAENLRAGIRELRREHDERWEIAVFRPQPVADPRAEAGSRETHRAGVDAERGLEVVVVVAAHGAHEADVVHALADVREEIADLGAAGPAGFEVPERREENVGAFVRSALAAVGLEPRLWVERVHVRHAAGHEEEDHALRFAGEMRDARRQRLGAVLGEQMVQDAGKQHRTRDERADYLAAGAVGVGHGFRA
ncbi:MAG: hypothetical protein K8R23_00270 [Chthoniobacter sp.]|nr:hypothetical protein [Chthoniobacter sp.]